MSLSFITTKSFIVWGIMLFLTRIGAAVVEIMVETYFYKKITAGDSNLINIFKMTTNVAYVVASFFASIFLLSFGMKYIWVVLGLIMLLGLRYSLRIQDTK
jgi:predicted MFS family arabinose efflux permease